MAAGKRTGSSSKKNTGKSNSKSSLTKNQSASKNSASSRKKTTTHSGGKTASRSSQPQKPIRREVGAACCLVAAVFTLLGCFSREGVFIFFMRRFFGGLFGWGFYFVPLSFLLAAVILFLHHGRPIKLRVTSALLLPVFAACLYHLSVSLPSLMDASGKIILEDNWIGALWENGKTASNGGLVGGALGTLFAYMFSRTGAGILFAVFGLLFLWIALGPFITTLIVTLRDREYVPYEPDPVPDRPVRPAAPAAQKPSSPAIEPVPIPVQTPVRKTRQLRPLPDSGYDLALDDVPSGNKGSKKNSTKKSDFFSGHSETLAPDEFLSGVSSRPSPAVEIAPPPEDAASTAEALFNSAQENVKPTEISVAEFTAPAAAAFAGNKKAVKADTEPDDGFVPPAEENAVPAPVYRFPSIDLLSVGPPGAQSDGREEIALTRERLENTLRSFGINAVINNVIRGPSVTRYEMELEVGVRLNRLTSLSDDIALALGASGVRIAAIPNRQSTVGIEVPNSRVSTVYLRELIDSPVFRNASSKLTFALGKNIAGEVIVGNIAKLPHLLVAGTTGSGKSVCLNALILSILYKSTPDEVKFIMVDPKMVEFKVYMGIPHLLVPVVTEAKKASGALQWAVGEMMRRYQTFSENGAREIGAYNKLAASALDLQSMPQIVIIIDELADLMLVAAKEVEESICRIAQMGRAAGIHLVIATQSPRADIITGLMKANIPSRIALKVASGLESRIILDAGGSADKLMGNGDMLFAPIGSSKPERIQGAWVSDEEREAIVDFIKAGSEANYSDDVIRQIDLAAAGKAPAAVGASETENKLADYDELLPQAVDVIFEVGQASTSMLQRRLKLGFARAARLIDQMEELGVLGPYEGSKPRQIKITKAEWQEMIYMNGTAPMPSIAEPAADPGDTGEDAIASSSP